MSNKKRSLALLAAGLLATAVFGMGLAAPATAAAVNDQGTAANPVKAAITKNLEMPINTVTPGYEFTFTFVAKSLDDETTDAAKGVMPVINPQKISFAASDAGNVSGALKTVSKESADFLAGLAWKHAGVYTYTVTEEASGNTVHSDTDYVDSLTYSKAVYDIKVFVDQDENGVLYAKAVYSYMMVDDEAVTVSTPGKSDPTPGGDPDVVGDYSQLVFTNLYNRNNGGTTPSSDEATFEVSKQVEGPFGDMSKFFEFSVMVDNAATVNDTTPRVYTAYVMDANGIVALADNGNTGVGADGKMSFTAGTAQNVLLKSGQKLVFVDTYVGTPVTVSERPAQGYIPSYKLTLASSVKDQAGQLNTALGLDQGVYTADGANIAAFTNTRDDVSITGVSMENMPFIAIAGLAVLALAGFVLVRVRRNASANAR
ncbi:MAG: hypothetical protein LBV30_07080 [Propionibacteriaceae bacterium]|nr:hypothetical protein [Propionibacteriaceae bacterium]